MKFSTTLLMTVLGSIGATNAYHCPLGKVGECCIAPEDKICQPATRVPAGSDNWECIFIDEIARNPKCCIEVGGVSTECTIPLPSTGK